MRVNNYKGNNPQNSQKTEGECVMANATNKVKQNYEEHMGDIDQIWSKLYCDKCEQFRQDIVRFHTFDGKLCCKDCWEKIKKAKEAEEKLKKRKVNV